MKLYDRLIFVSNSDTATGPMAEAILANKYLLDKLDIVSKGVVVLFPEPVNPKAEAVLESYGMSQKDHMSEPFSKEDFADRTLILALSDAVCQKIRKEYPENAGKIHALHRFVEEETEVTDPYGGSLIEYGMCFDILHMLISKLVVYLNEQELLS